MTKIWIKNDFIDWGNDQLFIGDIIECTPEDLGHPIEGMIGEIAEHAIYLWNDNANGSVGPLKRVGGYLYSWCIPKEQIDSIDIKLLKRNAQSNINHRELNKKLCTYSK